VVGPVIFLMYDLDGCVVLDDRVKRPIELQDAELVGPEVRVALSDLVVQLDGIAWTRDALGAAMKAGAAKHGLKPGQVMMAMRVLVCGTRETPAIDAVLALLGRDRVTARLRAGLGG
jgi:glutamyl-tRNA synthetase